MAADRMRVIYYRDPAGNFGDDLNEMLWRDLLPASCFAADDAVLLGVGSILREEFLSAEVTRGKRVFILGSGAGTGPLPRAWPNPEWSVLAVRGPLTARLLGRPDAAVTDSAALLAVTHKRAADAARKDVLFVPHHNSVEYSLWPQACRRAGLVFVDPRRPVPDILALFDRARLVVTEAMHGAIVADTLRIPWVPVVCSPAIPPFKWVDWTRSLDLDYRPLALPPSSGWEAIKHRKIRLADPRDFHRGSAGGDADALVADFQRRYAGTTNGAGPGGRRLDGRARAAIRAASRVIDPAMLPRAAAALRAASRGRAYLSDQRVFDARLARLQDAVGALRRALGA
ncbi:MAG: polysaccharide pyruvyl transferase family protein [Variibacter sp.]